MEDSVKMNKSMQILAMLTFWYGLSWIVFPILINHFDGIMSLEGGTIYNWLPNVIGVACIIIATTILLFSIRKE